MPVSDHALPARPLSLQRRDQGRRIDLEPPRGIVRNIGRNARPLDRAITEQNPARLQRRGLRRCPLD